jgi:hypothetical protein
MLINSWRDRLRDHSGNKMACGLLPARSLTWPVRHGWPIVAELAGFSRRWPCRAGIRPALLASWRLINNKEA